MKKATVIEVIAALFILLFLYTALSKLTSFNTFKVVLRQSPLLHNYNVIAAITIPTLEILVSICLFVPRLRLVGLYGAFGLMTAFTLYIAYMLSFSPHLPCSCGGILKQMSWPQHLIFNIVFTILAYIGIRVQRRTLKYEAGPEPPPPVMFT